MKEGEEASGGGTKKSKEGGGGSGSDPKEGGGGSGSESIGGGGGRDASEKASKAGRGGGRPLNPREGLEGDFTAFTGPDTGLNSGCDLPGLRVFGSDIA